MKIKEVIELVEQGYEMRWDVETSLGKVNKLKIEKNVALKTLKALGERQDIMVLVDHEEKALFLEY